MVAGLPGKPGRAGGEPAGHVVRCSASPGVPRVAGRQASHLAALCCLHYSCCAILATGASHLQLLITGCCILQHVARSCPLTYMALPALSTVTPPHMGSSASCQHHHASSHGHCCQLSALLCLLASRRLVLSCCIFQQSALSCLLVCAAAHHRNELHPPFARCCHSFCHHAPHLNPACTMFDRLSLFAA